MPESKRPWAGIVFLALVLLLAAWSGVSGVRDSAEFVRSGKKPGAGQGDSHLRWLQFIPVHSGFGYFAPQVSYSHRAEVTLLGRTIVPRQVNFSAGLEGDQLLRTFESQAQESGAADLLAESIGRHALSRNPDAEYAEIRFLYRILPPVEKPKAIKPAWLTYVRYIVERK